MTTLDKIAAGCVVRVTLVEPQMSDRLAAMGILPGESLTIIANRRRGPVLVRVLDGRLMLGREAAARIHVA